MTNCSISPSRAKWRAGLERLRAGELANIVDKARIRLALCDTRIMDDLAQCSKESRFLDQVVGFDGTGSYDSELDRMALTKPVRFDAVATGRDDVALLAVNSGAAPAGPRPGCTSTANCSRLPTGLPGTFQITPDDVIVGSLPVVHTLGLVSLVICPLRFGAATVLLEHATPWKLVELVERSRASIVFSVPATCRAMLDAMDEGADLSSIRAAVLVGRPLPAALYAKWKARTGKPILNGIRAMLRRPGFHGLGRRAGDIVAVLRQPQARNVDIMAARIGGPPRFMRRLPRSAMPRVPELPDRPGSTRR